MASNHRLLKTFRVIHLYFGVFIAPAMLFFAITGGLQSFDLHEAARDGSYRPPAWLAAAGMLHKKQTTALPGRKPRPAAAAPADDTGKVAATAAAPAPQPAVVGMPKNRLPMKIFFVLVSLGLALSTITGLYMAYRYTRDSRRVTAALLAGIVVPIGLMFM